ncbi:polyketide cyclase/dehydrase/lipid transport protein [Streptomyces sp. Ag109_O5-1]|uniref:SRPBCC family protein n=1 Tax=Streptomyces sp. Ag109_O5-1 TaxID=1938851 RepID=UPI000F4D6F11|nr:SRPBCC family protein [Streptomyces sp. Ag109_O5-1]RPE45337.1 polyketide cyclase/dehydrase/lipid transport protein [Streptomyces sp. Ag109_O5-1]
MDWTHYSFLSRWPLPFGTTAVFRALERVEDYPDWWPQVRSVTRLNDTTGVITIRSVLPYDMTFTARETRRDPEAGVLEIEMSGDIKGWARWTVTADGAGTLARYEQVVDVEKPLLRRLAVPGRPFFRLNHRLMMRSGRRGLLGHLQAV